MSPPVRRDARRRIHEHTGCETCVLETALICANQPCLAATCAPVQRRTGPRHATVPARRTHARLGRPRRRTGGAGQAPAAGAGRDALPTIQPEKPPKFARGDGDASPANTRRHRGKSAASRSTSHDQQRSRGPTAGSGPSATAEGAGPAGAAATTAAVPRRLGLAYPRPAAPSSTARRCECRQRCSRGSLLGETPDLIDRRRGVVEPADPMLGARRDRCGAPSRRRPT